MAAGALSHFQSLSSQAAIHFSLPYCFMSRFALLADFVLQLGHDLLKCGALRGLGLHAPGCQL